MPLNIATSTIVALAFQALRQAPPAGLAEDTDLAQATAMAYAHARDEVIETTDWSWCSTQADLPAAEAEALPADADLPNLFAVPPDCLAFRRVGDDNTRWMQEGTFLRSDASAPLRVRYSRRIENEEQIPASAKTVIALRLAQLLLPTWGNTEDRRRVDDDFATALQLARRQGARTASVQPWAGRAIVDIVDEATA